MGWLFRRATFVGLAFGVAVAHLSLVGLVVTLNGADLIAGVVSVGSTIAVLAALSAGYAATAQRRSDPAPPPAGSALLAGALAGLLTGVVITALAWFIEAVNPRGILINASPQLVDVLHWGQPVMLGNAINVVGGALLGAIGAGLRIVPANTRRAAVTGITTVLFLALMQTFVGQILRGLKLDIVEDAIYAREGLSMVGAVGILAAFSIIGFVWASSRDDVKRRFGALQPAQQRTARISGLGVALIVLCTLPLFIGPFLSQTLDLVGIYILLGLGLNIVVGFAGLLDLGYVAFYAVGAYATAVLTSPASPLFAPQLDFWVAVPLVLAITAFIGLAIGAPVLRLRGDYLAIVTLGFGEIARIVFNSNWMTPYLGGSQGILQVPPPEFLGISLRDPSRLYYPILVACIIAAIAAISLANSRVGRAWTAMREDESVAEATGVNTTKYKLLAFALGATFGGLAGALYAVRIGTVFPQELNIVVSINALALIILGGIGSIPGVIVGAIVLVGLPELLREFSEYRLLLYGIVLVAMMLLRPEGLLPNRSRRAELHEGEDDSEPDWDEKRWERKAGDETPEPRIST
jgi:branched-chain amino acid transport system permease protein